MFRLEDLTLFVRAAALNSFSDAAREVGVQPAQVSSAIKRLESTLAIRLFARSTRSLRLTPEGERALFAEYERICRQASDMERVMKEEAP